MSEESLAAGRRGRTDWTVREYGFSHWWVTTGEVERRGGGTITYKVTPYPDGAVAFEHDFTYEVPNPLLNRLLLCRPMREFERRAQRDAEE